MSNKFYRNTICLIELDTIKENMNVIKSTCSKNKFLYAVVKGDGYGHGILQVTRAAIDGGANGIAVATLDEAMLVREHFKSVQILCLGVIPNNYYQLAAKNDIIVTIATQDSVDYLENNPTTDILKVHIKINSGMNRLGFNNQEDLNNAIDTLLSIQNIQIDGIFTHFATIEEVSINQQLELFRELYLGSNFDFNQVHCTNSYSLLKLHEKITFTNTNRVGIALYGALEDPVLNEYPIKTALSLVSRISQVMVHKENDPIGYSQTYRAKENEIIATIPIGYADGFARLHKGSKVKCKDQYGTIVGNICMDQLMVSFENMVEVDDEVIFISNDEELNVFKRATEAQTITHEIFTSITNRVPKVFKYNQQLSIDNTLLDKTI